MKDKLLDELLEIRDSWTRKLWEYIMKKPYPEMVTYESAEAFIKAMHDKELEENDN